LPNSSVRGFYAVFDDVLRETGDCEGRRRLSTHLEHRATLASLRDLLGTGGFAVRRVVERTGRMRFANGTALFNHHFIKLGFLDGWKQVVPSRRPEMFLRLRNRLDEIAVKHRGLELTIPMAYVEAVAV
jgi:arsenite methyltransferase